MPETRKPEPRIASLPDDPDAPLADRLLLALGISPSYLERGQVGLNNVVEAAVIIRTDAHRYPMVAEDFGVERHLRTEAVDFLRAITATDGCSTELLESARAFVRWVDDGCP